MATPLILAAGLAGVACREPGLVREPNQPPEAVARVVVNGQSVDEQLNGGEVELPFSGMPIDVTLDGTGSSDDDGQIARYVWLSGTPNPDTGRGRFVPEGESGDWPADQAQPVVRLGEGVWTFSLWVIDDDGARSEPDTITFTIGEPEVPMMSDGGGDEVQACIDAVVPGPNDACKACVCGLSPECRMAADPSVCGEPCWQLLACIGMFCAETPTDLACLMANCADSLSGGSGASAIGGCIRMCLAECRGE